MKKVCPEPGPESAKEGSPVVGMPSASTVTEAEAAGNGGRLRDARKLP